MIETIIAFLSTNKAIIGVIVCMGEWIVILINLWRKFRAITKGEVDTMSASLSKFEVFLWATNPINLFRKPK